MHNPRCETKFHLPKNVCEIEHAFLPNGKKIHTFSGFLYSISFRKIIVSQVLRICNIYFLCTFGVKSIQSYFPLAVENIGFKKFYINLFPLRGAVLLSRQKYPKTPGRKYSKETVTAHIVIMVPLLFTTLCSNPLNRHAQQRKTNACRFTP